MQDGGGRFYFKKRFLMLNRCCLGIYGGYSPQATGMDIIIG
jgi:hypothetical protein